MWTMSEFIKDLKSKSLDITSNNGNLHLNFNLLVAIILALILPHVTILVIILCLINYLDVQVQPNKTIDTTTEIKGE